MQRTDNDSWDLVTSVGATATMVAAARARATNADEPPIEDRFAEPLVRAVGIDFFTRWATGELDPAEVDEPDAPWGLQRMTDLLAARTRYFDQFFLDATAAGVRQAVILASGLDARGYRLRWPAGTTVFEIDQPDVIGFKVVTLAGLGAAPTADLRMVPIDLRQDWPAALRDAGFDAHRPTAWIAEGLLAFLPPDAQDRLLDNITALSADGSRLATETFVNSTDADGDGDEAQRAMHDVTEKWRNHGFDIELGELGYDGERHDVATYLTTKGWRSVRIPLDKLLTDNGFDALMQDGDKLVVGNSYYCTSVLAG
ncbi:MAG: putative S-adenosyl-L-methionine-dependent methyltransferase [Mycobacterium sp.]|jgi:methyltransferase (TIGR00027 family)|nr:putative S-adenosyl-L-methionine-dependent methyltransferase [Mycobacterium sp.]